MRVVAVDGKTTHGAAPTEGQVHLLAAFDPASRVVRGQTQVDGKSNELTAFVPLLDRIDLTDVLLTADALHTQRGMPSACMIAFGEDLFQIRAGSVDDQVIPQGCDQVIPQVWPVGGMSIGWSWSPGPRRARVGCGAGSWLRP